MEGVAPRWVEMRENLIKEEDRRCAGHLVQQSSMRQYEPDQERFLFPGRGFRGGDILCHIEDFEVAQMRPIERASGCGVAAAIIAQDRAVAFLDFACRMVRNKFLDPAIDG